MLAFDLIIIIIILQQKKYSRLNRNKFNLNELITLSIGVVEGEIKSNESTWLALLCIALLLKWDGCYLNIHKFQIHLWIYKTLSEKNPFICSSVRSFIHLFALMLLVFIHFGWIGCYRCCRHCYKSIRLHETQVLNRVYLCKMPTLYTDGMYIFTDTRQRIRIAKMCNLMMNVYDIYMMLMNPHYERQMIIKIEFDN